jgi:hypothetical protein
MFLGNNIRLDKKNINMDKEILYQTSTISISRTQAIIQIPKQRIQGHCHSYAKPRPFQKEGTPVHKLKC